MLITQRYSFLDWEEFVYKLERHSIISAFIEVPTLIFAALWAKFRHRSDFHQQFFTFQVHKIDFDLAVPVGDRDDCIFGIELGLAEVT